MIARVFITSIGGFALCLASACGGADSTGASAPRAPTVTIVVTPPLIAAGDSATLVWSSSAATSCTASDAWTGAQALTGNERIARVTGGTYRYALACTGPGGTTMASTTLAVTPAVLPTVAIAVSPSAVFLSQSVTVTWSSTGATGCAATGAWSGSRATSGRAAVTPIAAGTIVFRLTCTGLGGSVTDSTNITVATPSLSILNTFRPNAVTISTSEGAPYGDGDIFSRTPATNQSNFGYGPTKVIRLYICLSGQIRFDLCSQRTPTTAPLSASLLQNIDAGIAAYAGTGIRLIIRFTYNFGPIGAPDAPLTTILSHIDQVASILLKQRDLIFALEAGFIGTWGEWHHSTNGNDTPTAHRAVLDKETSYFRNVFPILLRYPKDLIDYGGSTADSALGLHDDYYASEAFDAGTWNATTSYTTAQLKAYAASASTTSMVIGEFGALYPTLQACAALADYSNTFHPQSLSLFPYPPEVGTYLVESGCASSFWSMIGTRVEISRATLVGDSRPGGRIHATLTMRNAGYGRVIRERPVSVVLFSNGSRIANIPISTGSIDLRTLPSSGDMVARAFEFDFSLPTTLPTGEIVIALFVADPAPSLTALAAYALPFNSVAQNGRSVFDPCTGANEIARFTPP